MVAGARVCRFAEVFTGDPERGADHVTVAGRPDRLLAGLDGGMGRPGKVYSHGATVLSELARPPPAAGWTGVGARNELSGRQASPAAGGLLSPQTPAGDDRASGSSGRPSGSENVHARPDVECLRTARLRGGVFFDVRLGAVLPALGLTAADCRPLPDDPAQIVLCHVVLSRRATMRDWIASSMRVAAVELAERRLASSGVMAWLSEVLRVEAVRHFAAEAGPAGPGSLRGLASSPGGGFS